VGKRFIRMDMEYEADDYVRVNFAIRRLADVIGIVGVEIIFTRDSSVREHLDEPRQPGQQFDGR